MTQADVGCWQVPEMEIHEFVHRRSRYCVCIPIINEGERIIQQLRRMYEIRIHDLADILILDGGSTDGSTDAVLLRSLGVRALLIKRGPGRLSAQLRMGYAFGLRQGYEGIVTVDGNGKDGIEAVPRFLEELDLGYDLVQGSRYLSSGSAANTPLLRILAIRLIHVPLIRWASGFPYTDTTNGFRAYSRRLLLDARVQPFRNVFQTYELLAYLSVRAPTTGHKVVEIGVRREYPGKGKAPTKISHFRGNLDLLTTLYRVVSGRLNPA